MNFLRKNLKFLLEQRKMMQNEFAAQMGVTAQAVTAWLNKENLPTKQNLKRIADFFQVDVEDLTYRDLTNADRVSDDTSGYDTDRMRLHLKKVNLKLEELIMENTRMLNLIP